MNDIGRKIVAEWLLRLWINKPDWLARTPNEDDVRALIELINKELGVIK